MSKKITQFKKGKPVPPKPHECHGKCMKKKERNQSLDNYLHHALMPWQHAFDDSQWLEPNIEVSESTNAVNVSAELPGMNPENIQVNVSQDGYLTISGEKSHQQEETDIENGMYFSERSYGMIQRTIPLPQDLNYEQTSADFENGVLSIHIPKSEAATKKVKKVPVQAK